MSRATPMYDNDAGPSLLHDKKVNLYIYDTYTYKYGK